MTAHDPAEAAQAARVAQAERAALGHGSPAPTAVRDPLPYCIYASVALMAWVLSPGLVVAGFAALGLRKYWRAYRAGLRASDCILGDPRRVMAYLSILLIAGAGWSIYALVAMLTG